MYHGGICIFYMYHYPGIGNYTYYPCPLGHYCDEASEPALCPAGQMRDKVGAEGAWDCPLCTPGYYCPNDTVNIVGIPCR